MSDLPIQIREMRQSDYGLVIQSWIRHARKAFKWLPKGAFNYHFEKAVRRALDVCPVWVLCSNDLDDFVVGWVCAEPHRGLIHFVFIKEKFRRHGHASRLVSEVQLECDDKITATHWTPDGGRFVETIPFIEGIEPNRFNFPGRRYEDRKGNSQSSRQCGPRVQRKDAAG